MCLALLVGCFAACGETPSSTGSAGSASADVPSAPADDSENEGEELEHMTITVGHWDIETFLSGGESDELLQLIQNKFNVTFEPVNVTWDDYGEKFQLWAATDSLPDMFSPDVRNSKTLREWAEGGVVRALPDDLSAWPHLKAYMETTNWVEGTVDGTLYALCRKTFSFPYQRVRDRVIYYRWDLAQAAGITEEPTNWDEFRAMIQAIIAADPENKDVAGMISSSHKNLRIPVVFNYSVPMAEASEWVDNGDGAIVPAYFEGEELGDKVLPGLQLVRDMYAEGTIDHDITMSNEDGALNKWVNGQSAAYLRTGMDKWDEYEAINGSVWDSVKVLHLMPAADGNTYYGPSEMAWSDLMFGSSCDDAKMERILAILDYLCLDETKLRINCGVEGVDYTVSDDKEIIFTEGTDRKTLMKKNPSVDFFANLVYWFAGTDFGEYKIPSSYSAFYDATMEQIYAEGATVTLPAVVPEGKIIARDIVTDFGGIHSHDDILTIMTGERPVEEMWNEILEQYKEDGLEEYIAQVNAQMK